MLPRVSFFKSTLGFVTALLIAASLFFASTLSSAVQEELSEELSPVSVSPDLLTRNPIVHPLGLCGYSESCPPEQRCILGSCMLPPY